MDTDARLLNPASELKVCHLVHSTKVGGVEVAAGALQHDPPEGIHYLVGVLSDFAKQGNGKDTDSTDGSGIAIHSPDCRALGLNNPLSFFSIAGWIRRNQPDLLIASLWRSVLVGAFLKMIWPRRIFVVFVHNTLFKNTLDRISHRIGFQFADAVFCDAEATRAAMVATPRLAVRPMHVVPLLARPSFQTPEHLTAIADASRAQRMADGEPIRFIYWGRMAGQKRLDRGLHFLADLVQLGKVKVHLDLIGPDEGQMSHIRDLAVALGLSGCVHWHGSAGWDRIRDVARGADFFLQLSDFEGLGMSVIEAMQVGLVPVVTPVGQIADFTTNGFNSIHYLESTQAAESVLAFWRNPAEYASLCAAAMSEWAGQESMQEAFAAACRSTIISARRPFRGATNAETSR